IEATVYRPKLIAPFDDAMSLIDGQERHHPAGARQRPHQSREALGCTIKDPQAAGHGTVQDQTPLIGREQAVQVGRGDAAAPQGRTARAAAVGPWPARPKTETTPGTWAIK